MTAEELLEQLETMTHADRVRVLIARGRQGDAESRSLVAALERGNFYERFLALYSCYGSADTAHVLRALADPSHIIRGLAIRLLALVCEETQVQGALAVAAPQVRLPLLWKLHKRRLQAPIDAYLERLAADDEAELCRLLPFGSTATVLQHADLFLRRATLADWTRLARFYPEPVMDLIERWAGTAYGDDARLVHCVNTLLPLLARAAPDRALVLLTVLQRTIQLSRITLLPLAERSPQEIATFMLEEQAEEKVTVNLSSMAHRLRTEQILVLYERRPDVLPRDASWFPRLAPEQRAAVYAAFPRRLRSSGILPASIVASLPHELREREARRHVSLERLDAMVRLNYAAYLPWDEALAVIEPSLHASEVRIRQAALRALIGIVVFKRTLLPTVLSLLRDRRTELDTVRQTIVQGLTQLPPSVWRPADLADLNEILRHGLNDVGLSQGTLEDMVALVVKLLPYHAAWCSAQLRTILRERGWHSLSTSRLTRRRPVPRARGWSQLPVSLLSRLSEVAARQLTQALLPVLTIWLEQENEEAPLDILESLPRRESVFVPVLPALEEMVRRTRTSELADRALRLMVQSTPLRAHVLILELVREDSSWITIPSVSGHLLRHRQDLLAPFLDLQTYGGRWSTGRKRFLPPLAASFTCGTALQQERFADSLLAITQDATQDSIAITRAVKMLARLPAISPARLGGLAGDPRSVVRTTAVFALGHLDTDSGLSTLIEALQDARARIAIHALRPFLLAMSAAKALAILRDIPLDRVTVAKEVMRLVSDLPSDEAYAELVAFEQRDLHRDVRIALVQSLGSHLDRDETWAILERAAQSPEKEIAVAPLALQTLTPWGLTNTANRTIRRRAFRLFALLLQHPRREVRKQVLRCCWQLALPDDERVLVPRLLDLARTASDGEAESALSAVFGICADQDAASIAQVVRDLLGNRQVLQGVVQSLQMVGSQDRRRLLAVARAIIVGLASDPLTAQLRVRLASSWLPAGELSAFFVQLAERNELRADVLVEACDTLVNRAFRLRLEAEHLHAIEMALAASPDERLRRIGFAALLAQTSKTSTWDDDQIARLRSYRADTSPLVAAAAQFTFPNGRQDEEDEEADGVDDNVDW